MDKKRFTVRRDEKGAILIPNSILKDGEIIDEKETVDLLNELYEDNRQLKVLLQEAEDEIDRLKKSNKQWMESLVNMESED